MAPPRRTELRAVPPGGRCQLFRQPFARCCKGLRYDERALLVWLLVEVDRRRRGPALSTSKAGMKLSRNRRHGSPERTLGAPQRWGGGSPMLTLHPSPLPRPELGGRSGPRGPPQMLSTTAPG
ncbi:MAG TPA: hypothetical protein VK988_14250 [Acidimicrobiales bacterium]|nr:hypothetical protein [Acidimicrobiales bacterium]